MSSTNDLSKEPEIIHVSTSIPLDLYDRPEFYASKKELFGSILAEKIPIREHVVEQNPKRSIYVMRHGERLDYAFPNVFESDCTDQADDFHRTDLNMPSEIPWRTNGLPDWKKDPPLSKLGEYQAMLFGDYMKKFGIKFDLVISSPAFRCVQTSMAVLKGLNSDTQICIDAALYEWTGWMDKLGFIGGQPNYYTPKELKNLEYNIDEAYCPILNVDQLKNINDETLYDAFHRNSSVVEKAIQKNNFTNILIVGHSSCLDNCTRKLLGKSEINDTEMIDLMKQVPFCGVVKIQENYNGEWNMVPPPLSQVTHSHSKPFDWTKFNS